MARPVKEDLLHLSPDPTRRARILRGAQVFLELDDADRDHMLPMHVRYWAIVDALAACGPVILRTDQLVGLHWSEKLPDDQLWRVGTDGAVTPYDPKESNR